MNILQMNPHETLLFPLAGSPIRQSVGSDLYNRVCDVNDINALFFPKEIREDELGDYFAACKRLKCRGTILTMPLKGACVRYLDEVDEISRRFHSVNCIRFDGNRMIGHGFDGKGLIYAFDRAGVDLRGKSVMMIGAGGVGGIFAAELAARGIRKLTILNRTVARAQQIADELSQMFSVDASCLEFTADNACRTAESADIFLQATSQGMLNKEDFHDLGFIDCLPLSSWVMDAVMVPPETNVLRRAKARGLSTLGGLDLMVCQMEAVFAFLMDVRISDESKQAARDRFQQLFARPVAR